MSLIREGLNLLTDAYYGSRGLRPDYHYFKKRGIPQLPTEYLYGNFKDLSIKKKNKGELFRDFYFEFKQMGVLHGGVYEMNRGDKSWIPVDPQLIKSVLTRDFQHFSARYKKYPGMFFTDLFHMDGEEWKDMRSKLSPAFTSEKMKMMFDIMLEVTQGLTNRMNNICKLSEPFDIEEVFFRYTVDMIANCGFGIESKAIQDINSDFFKIVTDNFTDKSENKEKDSFRRRFVLNYLGLPKPSLPKAVEDFCRNVAKDTINYRELNHVIRKDFVHSLIELKNKGVINVPTKNNEAVFKKTVKKEVMSLEEIAEMCLMFLSDGFETCLTTISFTMLELAHNQNVQKKLRDEVGEVLKRHNGKLSFEAIQEMRYCENVMKETLRKFPPIPIISRLCTQDYRIPGTDSKISKGTNVVVPILGLHMDPDYFSHPENFIPERFNFENKNKIQDYTFLPFGEGPRMCLGLQFGIKQSKACLATLINSFNFTLSKRTPYPPIMSKTSMAPALEKDKIWLEAVKLD